MISLHLQTDSMIPASLMHRLHIVVGLVSAAVGEVAGNDPTPHSAPEEEDQEKQDPRDQEAQLQSIQGPGTPGLGFIWRGGGCWARRRCRGGSTEDHRP